MERDEPWKLEPDYVRWIDAATGYECVIRRGPMGNLNGYVRVPADHPWYRRDYRERIERVINVHGGITYSGRLYRPTGGTLRGHWFAFDTAHAGDFVPKIMSDLRELGSDSSYGKDDVYRDITFVRNEVVRMAQQLAKIGRSGKSVRRRLARKHECAKSNKRNIFMREYRAKMRAKRSETS